MKIPIKKFPEIKVFETPSYEGESGFFRVTYLKNLAGKSFDQDSISLIEKQGTIKGLHFQKVPFAQEKFVSVLQGEILDIIVDIDQSSRNFLNYSQINLSSTNNRAIFIPKNFAHGYITLTDNVIVSYKIVGDYNPENECTLKWDDSDLDIDWPKLPEVHISKKDINGLKVQEFFKI